MEPDEGAASRLFTSSTVYIIITKYNDHVYNELRSVDYINWSEH